MNKDGDQLLYEMAEGMYSIYFIQIGRLIQRQFCLVALTLSENNLVSNKVRKLTTQEKFNYHEVMFLIQFLARSLQKQCLNIFHPLQLSFRNSYITTQRLLLETLQVREEIQTLIALSLFNTVVLSL